MSRPGFSTPSLQPVSYHNLDTLEDLWEGPGSEMPFQDHASAADLQRCPPGTRRWNFPTSLQVNCRINRSTLAAPRSRNPVNLCSLTLPMLLLAGSPPASRSLPTRQQTSHDGRDAWRCGRSDREFFLATASRSGEGEVGRGTDSNSKPVAEEEDAAESI